MQGKRYQADAHAKIISYLERKGFVFHKNDPFLQLECDGEYSGDLHQHRFFEVNKNQPIHVASTGNMVSSGTTGFFLWEGSVAFLALLSESEDFKAKFKGMRILELGSGAGLAGISIATLAEPASVLLTDIGRVLETFTAPNCKLNPVTLATDTLDWCDHEKLDDLKNEFDVVIGCDLVYDPAISQLLLEACRPLLQDSKVKEIILLCTLRNPQTFETFVREARHFATVSISELTISLANPIIVTEATSLRLLSLSPIPINP
jgi:hypothetical protein